MSPSSTHPLTHGNSSGFTRCLWTQYPQEPGSISRPHPTMTGEHTNLHIVGVNVVRPRDVTVASLQDHSTVVNWEWAERMQEGPGSETLLELPSHPCPEALWAGRCGGPTWVLNPCGLEVSEEEGGGVGYEGILWEPGGRGDALVGGGPS